MGAIEEVRCPKCGSAKVSLYKAYRFLHRGVRLEEIVCRICSQVLASRATGLGRRRRA